MKIMSFIILPFLFSGLFCHSVFCAQIMPLPAYAVAKYPTPVFSAQDFIPYFRSLDFIAFPGSVFRIKGVEKYKNIRIYKVTDGECPETSVSECFIDSRFVRVLKEKPPEKVRKLPGKERILSKLVSCKGTPYLYGGNFKKGVPQMLQFYGSSVKKRAGKRLRLKGLDCSGLLYWATGGCTPRNSTDLSRYGDPVHIEDLTADEIIKNVKPLDLIVWNGHVIIILDRKRVIESRPEYETVRKIAPGVRIRPLKEVLEETLQSKNPVDDLGEVSEPGRKNFVIRRWYPF